MGCAMAGHLLDAGYTLRVFNRTADKAGPLLRRGAVWCETPAAVAESSDAIFTIVGLPRDVEQVYLSADGLVARARPGAVLVDMTTSSPTLARQIAKAAADRGVSAMDAPVTGGDKGAREATLTFLVGGDADAFERMRPLFSAMGRRIVRLGGPGAGQDAKLANQIAIAGAIQGVAEALAYCRGRGLDAAAVLDAIQEGAAGSWQMRNIGPRMLAGDEAPGFLVRHLIKDLQLAQDACREAGVDLPAMELALARYRRLAEAGGEMLGTQALFREYRPA